MDTKEKELREKIKVLEKENKTVNHNYGFGDMFRYINIRTILKWFLLFIIITSILSLIAYPVKIESNIDCNSGDIDLDVYSVRDLEEDIMKMQDFNLNGIDGLNCKGKINIDVPLIGLLFMN